MTRQLLALWHWCTGWRSPAQILRELGPLRPSWLKAGLRERRW
jgi:hypothetical protein